MSFPWLLWPLIYVDLIFHDFFNLYYSSSNLTISIFDVWCSTLMFENCWFSQYALQIFMDFRVTQLDKFDMLRKWGWIELTMYCLYACYKPYNLLLLFWWECNQGKIGGDSDVLPRLMSWFEDPWDFYII